MNIASQSETEQDVQSIQHSEILFKKIVHLVEICILEILDTHLMTHDHQFDFKSRHSADMCIFILLRV